MGIGHLHLVTVAAEGQLLHHERVQEPDQVGARADQPGRVGERLLEGARPAELFPSLQDEDAQARPGQVGRGGQAVVAPTHDHDVPAPRGQLGHRGRQPDPPEDVLNAHCVLSSSPRPRSGPGPSGVRSWDQTEPATPWRQQEENNT